MKPLTPPCFPSHNITKSAENHPLPMRDVIMEQPQTATKFSGLKCISSIEDNYSFLFVIYLL